MWIYLSTAEPGILLPTLTFGNLCMTHTELPITTINPCHQYPRPLEAPILLNRAKHLKFQSYVLCNATPPTVLDLEGWYLDLYLAIIGILSIRIFFGIGPRVPELGPKMWSRMLYLSFQLSDWDEICVVTVFLNCIATSNFEPML